MPKREKLVFLPGHMCDERLFAPQIESFRDSHEIAVADFRHGRSFADHAAHVLELTGGEPVNLCGLSMGGMIAGEFAALHPGLVRRLALLATTLRPDSPHRTATRRERIARAASQGMARITIDELLPTYLARRNMANPDLRDVLLSMAVDAGLDVFGRQSEAMTGRIDRRAELASFSRPVLVLCGDEDQLFSVESHRQIAAIFPDAMLEVLPGTGHIVTLELLRPVNHALQAWLARSSVIDSRKS